MSYVLALAAVILASINFVAARMLIETIQPATLAFARWLFVLFILLPTLVRLIRGTAEIASSYNRCIIAGVSGVAVMSVCLYSAARNIDALTMALLAASVGIFYTLFQTILTRSIDKFALLGGMISIIGVVVLVAHINFNGVQKTTLNPGEIWMLCAAVVWAFYLIIFADLPVQSGTDRYLSIVAAAPFLAILTGVEANYEATINWTRELGVLLILLAIFPAIMCVSLWQRASEQIPAKWLAALASLFPIPVGIAAAILLEEYIYPYQYIGGTLIIVGLLVTVLKGKQPPPLTTYV